MNATELLVVAGPVEATAAGNIIVQAIAHGDISGIDEGRSIISESFSLTYYEPQESEKWDSYYQTFKQLFS